LVPVKVKPPPTLMSGLFDSVRLLPLVLSNVPLVIRSDVRLLKLLFALVANNVVAFLRFTVPPLRFTSIPRLVLAPLNEVTLRFNVPPLFTVE